MPQLRQSELEKLHNRVKKIQEKVYLNAPLDQEGLLLNVIDHLSRFSTSLIREKIDGEDYSYYLDEKLGRVECFLNEYLINRGKLQQG